MDAARAARRPIALLAAVALAVGHAVTALADSPAPSQAAQGDPRGGQPAGFAGDPGLAIAVVVVIALVALVATLAWIRATGGPVPADQSRDDDRAS